MNAYKSRPIKSKIIRPTLRPLLIGLGGLLIIQFSPHISFAAFQETLWGARPAALGGAYTSIADDANAPAYNPAGISLMPKSEVTFMYAHLYSGLNFYVGDQGETSRLGLGYVSFVPTILDKRYGSFGFSWSNLNATHLYREDSFTLTYADSYQFDTANTQPIFSYGLNLKMLRRSFSTDERTDVDPVFQSGRDSNAMTLDLGVMVQPHFPILPGLRFGLAGQNVTEPDMGLASGDRVPSRTTLGVAYQDRYMRWFNPTLDVSKRDGETSFAAGWESWFARDTLALRVGGSEDNLSGGMGYQFRLIRGLILKFDYAIIWPLNVEGSNGSHRVSMSTNF